MSSSCVYTRRPALSPRHFSRLSTLLKDANARYAVVATSVRAATQPSHSARARAHKLGLAVNVRAAAACPEAQVSVNPLPVLERSTPPPTSPLPHKQQQQQPTLQQQRGRPALRLVLPRAQADVPISTGPYSTISLAPTPQPSAAAAAPTVLRGQNVPWRGPTSRFSVTPSDPIFSVAPALCHQGPSDLAPFILADVDLFSVPPRPAPRPEEAPVVPEMLFEFDADEEWELGYPPASGAADYASSSSSCASSSSGSSSSRSGPVTPDDADALMPGLLAAFNSASAKKRKTSAVLDFDEARVVDKCPKYQRKSWARTAGRQLC
ncbi:hypothetical protein DFH08DRAFT_802539 [Mycena albidolilacea]|uniref:Uncharacterized protein n=1 Tax=Mycena albidolilacea TaxID=1033008 RepID=A0AAD7AFE1_9AGAR|nr:hypothetical protein DFH08DRAFT_802539 [Mycena albidolilacea]